MKKLLFVLAIILGVIFLGLAFVYWTTPASALPSFLPGHDPAMTGIHFKHGLAAFILAILVFLYAWFVSGKKKSV